MRTMKLIDVTLREGAAIRGRELTFKEKLEIARNLDRLKVDTIELAPIGGSKAEELSNSTSASMVSSRISACVNIADGDIEKTWDSIRVARKPKLNLLVPVSPVQMEYICHKKDKAMLSFITEKVKECRYFCEHVEFSALDATRAEKAFLCEAITAAVKAGAYKVTLCDSAGIMMPQEFGAFVKDILSRVPELSDIELYVEVSDEMHMAVACGAEAVSKGATGVKCTAVRNGYPTLEEMIRFVKMRGADLDIETGMRVTEIHRVVTQLEKIIMPQEEEVTRFSNISLPDAAGVTLDENDEIGEVIKVVRQLGYDLSEEDNAKVYEAFRRVVTKKHFVGTKELDAIVAGTAMQVPPTYKIINYVINSGNIITATANILLEKDGESKRGVGTGDGPIDAAFAAIEMIIGHRYELDDFQIQTVTEGRDSMGSALIKLRANGKVYSGNGLSTDIIGASIRAYISALNKIIYEEADSPRSV